MVSTPTVLTVRGQAVLRSSGELAAGVTVVAEDADAKQMFTAISDEVGGYVLEMPPGVYTITAYYLNDTKIIASHRLFREDTTLPPEMVDDTIPDGCWGFRGYGPAIEMTSRPWFGAAIDRPKTPVARDRTHVAWIAPVAMAEPARVVTTVDGARRLAGAPGIPIAFVEAVVTHTLAVPAELAQGSGGAAEVSLRGGSNQRQAEARVILGVDDRDASTAAETFLGGPLVRDHAWGTAGLVLRRDAGELTGDGMLRFEALGHDQQQLLLTALGQQDRGVEAGFTNARWKGYFQDHKLELGALVTGEVLLRDPDVAVRAITPAAARSVDRIGGLAYVQRRFRAGGWHIAMASAGGGFGERDGVRHTDASYVVGDEWVISSLTLKSNLRLEERSFAGERTRIVVPRTSLEWDPTGESRSALFIGYQRVPLVDDGQPGDWRTLADQAVGELFAGVSYRRAGGSTMLGLAARQRGDQTGGEAWLRRETTRSMIHLQGVLAEDRRVATLLAQHTLRDRGGSRISAGTTARISQDGREAGAALGWKRSTSRRELATELTAEGYAGTAGPGARLVLGMVW